MQYCVSSKIVSHRQDGSPVPFPETLEFVKKAGFTELDYSFTIPELLRDGWERDFMTELAQAEEAGVRFRFAHMPFDYPDEGRDFSWDDFYLGSCRAMELAVRAGVDCAAIHPYSKMKRDYEAEREYEAACAFLIPYRDAAKRAGLRLALENMRGPGQSAPKEIRRCCQEVGEVIRVADELGLGICWDTGHGNISGQPQRESLLAIGGRLLEVHLNDNHAEDDIHLAPFLGTIRWAETMQALREIGYRGSLNLEVQCTGRPDALREAYAAYMGGAVRELEKLYLAR